LLAAQIVEALFFLYHLAIELLDDESVEIVEKQLNLVNPLKRSPFCMLIETSGSDYDHDNQVTVCCVFVYAQIVLV